MVITVSEQPVLLAAGVLMVRSAEPIGNVTHRSGDAREVNTSQPQIHRIAHNMCCARTRMRELLEEFLDRAGVVAENGRATCEIHELVASAVEKIALDADFQSVHIVQDVSEGLVLTLDRRLIRRVFVNLLVNALQVMPDGGTINVSALSDQHSVLIRVRDTGPGISPEIRKRLFEPFATAGKRGGIGLGLAFSRQAVTDHGGEIWAEPVRSGACLAVRRPKTTPQRLQSDLAKSGDAAPLAALHDMAPYSRRAGTDLRRTSDPEHSAA